MEGLGFLKKRSKEPPAGTSVLQVSRDVTQPFSVLERYVPLSRPELEMYRSIREAVPVIDAAISKTAALVGGFSVKCEDTSAQRKMDSFLKNVQVGETMAGIDCFIRQYLDGLITNGTAVAEIVPSAQHTTVSALYTAPLDNLELERDGKTGGVRVCVRSAGKTVPAKWQNLLTVSALNPKPGEIRGNSVLSSMPFVTGILLKIYNSIGTNFDRVGNVRFAVTYKPSGDGSDRTFAKDRAVQLADQWAKAMRDSSSGKVSDFVAVGDVQIKVIGADNQILDCEIPVRQMLEQIVARLGLPPFMLGLSWSSTERMSSQQADLLTSELEAYRRLLDPVIIKICRVWLMLNGFSGDVEIEWDNISLQDEVELARAQLYRMQAKQIEKSLNKEEK